MGWDFDGLKAIFPILCFCQICHELKQSIKYLVVAADSMRCGSCIPSSSISAQTECTGVKARWLAAAAPSSVPRKL